MAKLLRTAGLMLALSIWVAIPYQQVRHHDFVDYDDQEYVFENPYVKAGLSWSGVRWAFTSIHAANWHPLTWLSHMADVELFGLSAGGHHLINLALHIANTLLVFTVFRRMTGAVWRSFFLAVLFGIHPLHVESVAWVAERKDMLSTFLGLICLLSWVGYAQQGRRRCYAAALVSFALGLMAKPMLVTLPCLLLLLDVWPFQRVAEIRSPASGEKGSGGRDINTYPLHAWGPLLLEKAPFFLLSLGSAVITVWAQQDAMAPRELLSLADRLCNAITSYAGYLGHMFRPENLAVFYPLQAGCRPADVIGSAALLAAISAGAFHLRRSHPYVSVGWLWYLGTLVPVIGIVQVGSQAMADRYTYLPLIGVFLMLTWGVADLAAASRNRTRLLAAAAVPLLVLLTVLCHRQVDIWKDDLTLFSHAARVTRHNHVAMENLGVELTRLGRFEEAAHWLSEALKLKPQDASIHNNVGYLLGKTGEAERSIQHYRQAVLLDPKNAEARNNLGVALARQGRFAEAIQHYERAVRLKPYDVEFHYNYGISLVEVGRLQDAEVHYRKVLELEPRHPLAANNLGVALARQGKFEEAIEHFSKALAIDPDYHEARQNLAAASKISLQTPSRSAGSDFRTP